MNNPIYVEFPGLSDKQWTLDSVAFTLFGKVDVMWYGIFITLGIVLAFMYVAWRGKRNEGVILDDILDVGIWTVILGVIGARLYYVLSELDQYHSLIDMINIRKGGLGIYGGIIGGCLGIVIVCKVKKLSWLKLFDMAAPAVMIAQAVGRWGNFFNGEAYGYPITEGGTRYFFFLKEFTPASGEGTFFNWIRMGLYPNIYDKTGIVYVHPTFLYECVWNVVGFVLLNLFYKHKKFNGQLALMYFTWYGFGRMLIEGFRSDSLYLFKGAAPDTGLRISQCLGLLCFVVGGTLLLIFSLRASAKKNAFAGASASAIDEEEEVWSDGEEDEEDLEDVNAVYGDATEEWNEPDEAEKTENDKTEISDEEEEWNGTEN